MPVKFVSLMALIFEQTKKRDRYSTVKRILKAAKHKGKRIRA